MRRKSQRKTEFLEKHPLCCFCGGLSRSVEIDHIPSRVIFDNRQWPEKYEFPACKSCNELTRHYEQVIGLLSRIYPDASTDEQKKEVIERIRAVKHNYPEVFNEIMPTHRQLREARKEFNWPFPASGSIQDLPILSVKGPLVNEAITNFGAKLSFALFYKHTGSIVPIKGGVFIKWFSNAQIFNDKIPREFAPFVANFPELKRNSTDLSDQFFYRYGVSEMKDAGIFLSFFRQSFAIAGFVLVANPSDRELPPEANIIHPFSNNNTR